MPPALNLSQDQTLQFNTCVVPSSWLLKPRSFERSLTLRKLTGYTQDLHPGHNQHVLLCEHFITCKLKDRSLPHPLSSAHTYRLFVCLLKNWPRFALLAASLLCLQQRNETIKNYLRFINTFLIFSCSGQ